MKPILPLPVGTATLKAACLVRKNQDMFALLRPDNSIHIIKTSTLHGFIKTFLPKIFLAIAFTVVSLFFVSTLSGQANFSSNVTTGNWNTSGSWTITSGSDADGIPDADDNVTILDGQTVAIDADVFCTNLTVGQGTSGTLTIGNNNLDWVASISGNCMINSGGTFNTAGDGGNSLTIGGNLTNNGTFDMRIGSATADVSFNGAANQAFSGAGGTSDFNLITINNIGSLNNNIVEISSTNFTVPITGFLTLTDGILKVSGSYTLSNRFFTSAGYTIGAGTGIWLNNPNVTISGQASDVTLTGSIQVTAGNYIIGINGGRSLRYNTGSSLILDGGTMTISQSLVGTNVNQTINFNMSAGTLTVLNFTSINGFTSFDISAAGSSFTMSGGTIILQNENTNGTMLDYRNIAGSGTITGGTVQFGTSATAGSPTFTVGVSPATNIFPSLSLVKAATSTTVTLNTSITVKGNVTIPTLTTFAANNQAIGIPGNSTNPGNWTNSGGTFTPGTQTVTFNGTSTQTIISGTSSFNSILHNGTGTLQLSTNGLTTTGTFTNSAGIFDANGIQHTVNGLATISNGEYQAKGGAQTFNGNLLISGGTFTGAGGGVVTIDLTLSSGTLTAPSGLFRVFGNWNKTGGTFNPGSNTVTFAGNSTFQNITSGGTAFNNVEISIGTSTRQLLDPLTVNGTFTMAIASAGGGFNANGFATTVAGLTTAASFGTYQAGTGTQTFNGGLTVSGGTFTGSSGTVNVTNVSIISGTLNAPSGAGGFNVSGSWIRNTAAVFNPNSGSVTFNGTGTQTLSGSTTQTFNNVIISKTAGTVSTTASTLIVNNLTQTTGNFTAPTTLDINGSLTLTNGTLTSGVSITIAGDWTKATTATFVTGGTVTFDGAGAQAINGTATSQTFFDMAVSKTAGNLSVSGNTTTLNVSRFITLTSGIFDAGTATAINMTGNNGNWTNNGGTFIPGASIVTFSGTTQSIGGSTTTTFNNLILSGGTKTFGVATTTNGNLSISTGAVANLSTFTHSAGSLTLGGEGTASGSWGSTSSSATNKNNTYFAATAGIVNVANNTCINNPTITLGTIPAICAGATSFAIPYTATTGNPDQYSISGTGITPVANGSLGASPIIVNLSSGAVGTSIPFTLTVRKSATGCASSVIGSVTVNPLPTCSITDADGPVCPTLSNNYTATAGMSNYSWSITGNGAITDGAGTQTVTVNAGASCGVSYTLSVTMTDGNGCQSTCQKTVDVNDTQAPIVAIEEGDDANIGCNPTAAVINAAFTAPVFDDDCTVPTVTVSNAHTGTGCSQSDTRTWTATDNCGNYISVSQIISYMVDTEDPAVATAQGGNENIGCNPTAAQKEAAFTAPTFADNCGDPTVTVSTIHTGTGCSQSDTRTWTATDGCDNGISISQTISYSVDNEDPVVATTQGNDASLGCNPAAAQIEAAFTAPAFADNCGDPTVTVSTVHTGTGCSQSDTRTWTATDGCDNDISVSQTISYSVDTGDPTVATAQGNNANMGCNPTAAQIEAAFTAPTFADNCGDPTVTVSTVHTGTGCSQSDTRTWTATDGCDNDISVSQTISYSVDTENPTAATTQGNNANIGCNPTAAQVEAAFTAPTFADNCGDPTVTVSTVHTGTGCSQSDTRTWTATDGCDNDISVSQIISYSVDTEDPVVATSQGSDANLGCNPTAAQIEAAYTAPTFADNCGDPAVTVSTVHSGTGCSQSDTRTWTATDGCNNHISVSQTISYSVDNQAPTMTKGAIGTCYPTITMAEAAAIAATAYNDNCTSNAEIVLTVSTTGTCSAIITVTATDGCGNNNFVIYNTRIDGTSPVVTKGTIGTCYKTQAEAETAAIAATTSTDNCPGPVTTTTNTTGACSAVIIVTVTDKCGNNSSVSYNTRIDNVPPSVTFMPVDVTVNTDNNACQATNVNIGTPTVADNCGSATITNDHPSSTYSKGITNVTWTIEDACNNTITRIQKVTVEDHQNPSISCPAGSPFTRSTNTGLCNYKVVGTEFDPASFGDNCPGAVITNSFNNSNTLVNAILSKGTHTIIWTVTDASGNTSTCNIVVKVEDHENPSVICPSNIILTGGQTTATWTEPAGNDNCPGWTVTRTGPAPGSTFGPGVTTITYTVTDASGNQNSCSFTVTNNGSPTATCTNSNPVLYFGYTGDQTAIITATPTTGTAPFTVKITMNRPLKCNQINDAGDETWTGGSGGTTTGNGCPAFPDSTHGPTPVSTAIISSGSYSATVTLMADADITVTITDALGSVTTCTSHIHADDVRCFAGNSGNSKITICHQTGSIKNPCVKICVDPDALNEHLAHGDFLGKCTPDCKPTATFSRVVSSDNISAPTVVITDMLQVKALPNPSKTEFNLFISGDTKEKVEIAVFDLYGRKAYQAKGSVNAKYVFGSSFVSGMYIVRVTQGKNIQTLKVIKGR